MVRVPFNKNFDTNTGGDDSGTVHQETFSGNKYKYWRSGMQETKLHVLFTLAGKTNICYCEGNRTPC